MIMRLKIWELKRKMLVINVIYKQFCFFEWSIFITIIPYNTFVKAFLKISIFNENISINEKLDFNLN